MKMKRTELPIYDFSLLMKIIFILFFLYCCTEKEGIFNFFLCKIMCMKQERLPMLSDLELCDPPSNGS